MIDAFKRKREIIEKRQGPVLLETVTYRYVGHSATDSSSYRTQEEILSWEKKCPIERYEKKLTEEGVATQEELEAIKADITKQVEEAVEFAKNSPFPDLSEITMNVYAD